MRSRDVRQDAQRRRTNVYIKSHIRLVASLVIVKLHRDSQAIHRSVNKRSVNALDRFGVVSVSPSLYKFVIAAGSIFRVV